MTCVAVIGAGPSGLAMLRAFASAAAQGAASPGRTCTAKRGSRKYPGQRDHRKPHADHGRGWKRGGNPPQKIQQTQVTQLGLIQHAAGQP